MVTLVCRFMLFPGIAESQSTSTAQAPTAPTSSYTPTAIPTSSGTASPAPSSTATSTVSTIPPLANPVNPSNSLHVSNPSSPIQLILRQQSQTNIPLANSTLNPLPSQALTHVQFKSISEKKIFSFSDTSKSPQNRLAFITSSPLISPQKTTVHSTKNNENYLFSLSTHPSIERII